MQSLLPSPLESIISLDTTNIVLEWFHFLTVNIMALRMIFILKDF